MTTVLRHHPDPLNYLALSWAEATWDRYYTAETLAQSKISKCHARGWTGISLTNASPYELDVIRNLGIDPVKIMLIHKGGRSTRFVHAGNAFEPVYHDVWTKDVADAEIIHDALLNVPKRVECYNARFPVDPMVRPLFHGLNYLALDTFDVDENYERLNGGVISIQASDRSDTIRTMLALTQ